MRSVKQCIEFLTYPNTHIRAFSRGPGGKGGRPGEETQKAFEKKASAKSLGSEGWLVWPRCSCSDRGRSGGWRAGRRRPQLHCSHCMQATVVQDMILGAACKELQSIQRENWVNTVLCQTLGKSISAAQYAEHISTLRYVLSVLKTETASRGRSQ